MITRHRTATIYTREYKTGWNCYVRMRLAGQIHELWLPFAYDELQTIIEAKERINALLDEEERIAAWFKQPLVA